MRENGYYPPGAEFSSMAPWSEKEVPEKQFNVLCSQVLSKTVKCTTSNYALQEEDNQIDTSDTNWANEWSDNDHYTPMQLINLLKDFITKDLIYGDSKYSKEHLEHLLKECEDWVEDDCEFIEE